MIGFEGQRATEHAAERRRALGNRRLRARHLSTVHLQSRDMIAAAASSPACARLAAPTRGATRSPQTQGKSLLGDGGFARDRVARARDSSTGRDRWMSVSSRDSIRMGHTTTAAMARETRWARRETRSRARETTAERETTATRARLASRVSLASSRRRASGGATDARSRVRRAGEAVPVRRVRIRSSARAVSRGETETREGGSERR